MEEDVRKAKILIVDDELRNLKLMGAILKNYGYEYEMAANGHEALEKTKSFSPDLILLDIMMPEMDGYEACRRLKENHETRHILIVIVTALDKPEDMAKGFEAGADEFLSKPVNRFELIARIRNLFKIKYLSEEVTVRGAALPPRETAPEGKKKILIVEDEATIAKMMKKIFSPDEYAIKIAYNSVNALNEAEKEMPDIILLDLLLPDMNGLDLLKVFKGMDADIPVIIITAMNDLNTKIAGIESGADEYLIKPVNNEELIVRVKSLVKRAEMQDRLKAGRRDAMKKAITDHLTGLYNREYLDEYMRKEMGKVNRYQIPLTVVMMDIDYFKKINDTYGHLAGDMVLRHLAQILEHEVRSADIPFRYGGEEFVILLPGADEEMAFKAAERLRLAVKEDIFKTDGGNEINITISAGVYRCRAGEKLEQIILKADKALYEAKAQGRDRVVLHKNGGPVLTDRTG